MNALTLLIVGLRASYSVSCLLALIGFAHQAFASLDLIYRSKRLPDAGYLLPLFYCVGALGGLVWVGKRVLFAIVYRVPIQYDKTTVDALTTALGLLLFIAATFGPVWCKARNAHNDAYGTIGIAFLLIVGTIVALSYGVMHQLL